MAMFPERWIANERGLEMDIGTEYDDGLDS